MGYALSSRLGRSRTMSGPPVRPYAGGPCGAPRMTRGKQTARLVYALHLAALAAPILPCVAQDDVAAFYRGKQIRILVGSAAGGGDDLVAGAAARHMAEPLPGHPSITVQNFPAAGGMVMTNQLFNVGPKDGTVMATPINGIPTAPLLQPHAARFDPTKLNWIGSTNREP